MGNIDSVKIKNGINQYNSNENIFTLLINIFIIIGDKT